MDQSWEVIRMKVCRKCIDSDGKSNCRLPVDETCALEAFFPELLETVNNVRSSSYNDYVEALRQNVCAHCQHQLPNGKCNKRDTLECALDRYYPMIIEAIETIKLMTEEKRL